MRLIDKDKIYQKAMDIIKDEEGWKAMGIVNAIMMAETIDAEPVEHGEWIPQYVSSRGLSNVFECSVCTGHTYTLHKRSRCYDKYCRCCGAKMDGKCI